MKAQFKCSILLLSRVVAAILFIPLSFLLFLLFFLLLLILLLLLVDETLCGPLEAFWGGKSFAHFPVA